MQSSTESWNGVALTLSTARPLGATAAPDMYPLQIEAYAYDGGMANKLARSAGAMDAAKPAAMPEESLDSKLKKEDEVAQIQAEVEIAGFQALYSIAGRVSVDNTGTAKKVRIDTDGTNPAYGAGSAAAPTYLTASAPSMAEPALPGPVMLYRDGVFMGQALFCSMPGSGESGFGAEPDLIKVKRVEVESRMTRRGRFGSTSM